jgi:NAD(P)-dependent dehydrogenase (short-subunit alcohol dehydrogenase family)
MEVKDKVVVVTGAASGIGRALCHRFAREGARGIIAADVNGSGAQEVARDIGGVAVRADVSVETDVRSVAARALAAYGSIDLFCSNAGIVVEGGAETIDSEWQKIWSVNVMAHVYAARAVLPAMLQRRSGYLLNTASAAGLLSQIGSAPYSVTKHAALAFAEWLSITYGDAGIRVSALCPQGVRTNMLNEESGPAFLLETAIEPAQVADAVVEGLRAETFLILPHPEVKTYFERKATDYDRWIRGMRRLQQRIQSG